MRLKKLYSVCALFTIVLVCNVGFVPTAALNDESTTPVPTTPAPPDGDTRGYDLVIGMDDSTPVPQNVNEFISKLWATVESFSQLMFVATRHHFYIRSAELVVPATWNATNISTVDSYQTAHIRVSSRITIPRTENPNQCGEPGNYIELPLAFLESGSSQYGSVEKALLHLWARYRWGVWNEHGYPGSTRFPYFYKNAENDWQPVGCSDQPLQGDFLNLEGDPESCENDGEYPPGTDCRFFPSEDNTATSSLMYLSSLDSIVNFCTAETHNKEAPNKQNIFCQHKSAWEIIESSPDFIPGDELRETLPSLKTKVTKTTTRPLFYVLLDRGRTSIAEDAFEVIKQQLAMAFDRSVPNGVVSAVGSFPAPDFGTNPGAGSIVTELMPWTHTTVGDEEIKSKILNYKLNGPTPRDFGLALYDTFNKIKAQKHAPGAIVVVLKVGAGRNYDTIHYEHEILAAALEAKIKLFVVEIQSTANRPNVNLVNLVNTIGGTHIAIRSQSQIRLIEYIILREIYNQFRDPEITTNHRVVYKGIFTREDEISLRLHPADLSHVNVSFTTLAQLSRINATYGGALLSISESREWDEVADGEARFVYSAAIEFSGQEEDKFTMHFNCSAATPVGACSGLLAIYGLVGTNLADPYNIDVSASSREISYVNKDLEEVHVQGPFNIFAKVERNGRPVKNLASVNAAVYNLTANWTIALEDNGFGWPDVHRNDGVYSGTFIPGADGMYRIFVIVSQDNDESLQHQEAVESHPHTAKTSRLLPLDQLHVGCSIGQCNAIDPVETFVRVQDLQYSIVAQGFSKWRDQLFIPARISTLRARTTNDFGVNLHWTSPPIYSEFINAESEEPELMQVSGYEIYRADDIEKLLGVADESVTKIIIDSSNEPGMEEMWQGEFGDSNDTYFIGVRGMYCIEKDACTKGAMSNIIKVITQEQETITTTPIPTTTTQEPTEPEPSTESTTVTTTTRRTTTTRPPIVTEGPTTEEPNLRDDEDSKSWIQKPEGYWTVAGFGLGIVIIVLIVAAWMFFRNKCCGGKDTQRLIQR